jgi:putative hydrolase of HD superfamily
MKKRLLKILSFIEEIEKLKHIKRINTLSDCSRQESDAEHSWHLAIIVLLLKNELGEKFDFEKAVMIALVHDLIEIYAGDCWPSSIEEMLEKKSSEKKSAKKLFSQLPKDLEKEIKEYWQEYEDAKTVEAKTVKALDKIVYPLHYALSKTIVWHKEQSSNSGRRVYGRPHVKHNQVLAEIFEYYNLRLDKVKKNRLEPKNQKPTKLI